MAWRPLAVHLDNGWNTELSVMNIERAVKKLGVDLYTHVINWEEFKDLQLAFLKASTPDSEIPTDLAIRAILYKVASQERIKYILEGHTFRTEGKIPPLWSYGDPRYLKDIYNKFSLTKKKFQTYPYMSNLDRIFYGFIRNIKIVRPLYYLDYRKDEVETVLSENLGWKPYGGKHYESVYTRFFQSFLLIRKFGIDKRKVHLSAQIRSNQINRKEALEIIKELPLDKIQMKEDIIYVMKKLNLDSVSFNKILRERPKTFLEYKNNYFIMSLLSKPLKMFYKSFSTSTPQILNLMELEKDSTK